MNPTQLERYSFWWSELRLVIAAIALFMGGVPPIRLLFPVTAFPPLFGIALILCWIISGLASLYLLYRWFTTGQKVFGGKDPKDLGAFFVLVISGINLGLTGVLGTNIGMSVTSNHVVFVLVGLLYLASAIYLFTQFGKHGNRVF